MRLLLCDDHAIFREGLKTILAELQAELHESSSTDELLAALEQDADVDVVLLDLRMPGTDGFAALRELRSTYPTVPVVIVSASEDPVEVRRAMDEGASGFIPKSSAPDIFRTALQLVLQGSVYLPPALLASSGSDAAKAPAELPRPGRRSPDDVLTPRQREILVLMSRGLTNAEIGSALSIAEPTVKTHISAILQGLNVSNRTEAALVMRELGLDSES